jgi:two-component system sensor kinase FixL
MPITKIRKAAPRHEGSALRARWKGILDTIPAGAYVCDEAGLITYFNPIAKSFWGRAPKLRDPAHRYCGSLKLYSSDGTPMRHDECWLALALREGRKHHGRELVIERPDGTNVFAMAHAHPLRNDKGRTVGAVNLVLDISEQMAMKAGPRKIRALVNRDHGATLAMIELALAVLAGAKWENASFR